jgi:hypothetical protein
VNSKCAFSWFGIVSNFITCSLRPILILSLPLWLGLPSAISPSYFRNKVLYIFFSSFVCATRPAYLIFLGFITFISIPSLDDKEFLAVNINVVSD